MPHPGMKPLLDERYRIHCEKSDGYGSEEDPMANFTTVGVASNRPRCYYPVLRCLEKLTRAVNLMDAGDYGPGLSEELLDVAGLADCAELMRRDDVEGSAEARPAQPGASAHDRPGFERAYQGSARAGADDHPTVPSQVRGLIAPYPG